MTEAGRETWDSVSFNTASVIAKQGAASFSHLVEHVSDYAMFLVDLNGRVLTWNCGAERITGYQAEDMLGRPISLLFPPGDTLDLVATQLMKAAPVIGRTAAISMRMRKDGSLFRVDEAITPITNDRNETFGFLIISRETPDEPSLDQQLRESEERIRLMIEGPIDYALLMLDRNGVIVSWNLGAQKIKGYRADEIIGRHFSCFYPAERIELGDPERELMIAATQGRFAETSLRVRKDGSTFWANVVITALLDHHGEIHGYGKIIRDITEQKRLEDELRQRATIDEVTGAICRFHFVSLADREFERWKRFRKPLTLLYGDIDQFKRLNDTFGHAVGDMALRSFVNTCRQRLRAIDIVGRMGGDEFAILLPGTDEAGGALIRKRLVDAMAETVLTSAEGTEIRFAVSIGMAEMTDEIGTMKELIDRADRDMYRVKRAARAARASA